MGIDFYTWNTPNGRKISVALEEMGLPYTVHTVNISKGEQFQPDFLAISPNNRIPAIVDSDGPDGKPLSVFESGAILLYLAEKTGKFMPRDLRARIPVLECLRAKRRAAKKLFLLRSGKGLDELRAAAKGVPVVEATREEEVDAPPTGSIAHNHPAAHERTPGRERPIAIHARPERHPVSTAKSRERERRIAAREREQRRLRAEFEHAERVVERRPAVRRQPQVRYYRAGSRDPNFSDVWR